MTTKEYLSQIIKYDKLIENELAELDYLKNLANGLSSISTTQTKVKSSGDKDLLSKRVVKIIELERQIDSLVDNYVEKRRLILEQIRGLENDIESEVLYKRFFKGTSFENIGEEIGYSKRSVYNIYGSAMISFEQKYQKEYSKL